MQNKNLLIATNHFWVGGRETYIANYLRALKSFGIKASIIASSLFKDTPEALVFEEKLICGNVNYFLQCRNWIQNAHKFFIQNKPSLIWAHHFDLFPAWLISRLHQIPILTTFHGPLISANRPNNLMQALGMTLALHRGDSISGVSKEIVKDIEYLLSKKNNHIHLIPNTVELSTNLIGNNLFRKPKKFLLITRPDKIGHIRHSVLLFNSYRKRVNGSVLTIAGGITPDDQIVYKNSKVYKFITNIKLIIKYLGGKWIYDQGPHFFNCLFYINFIGYVSNPRIIMRNYDVVLGMGRVLLEGISEGKLCVLVGYDKICGLVTQESFVKYQWSNFSGRGISSMPANDVCSDILSYYNSNNNLGAFCNLISVNDWSKILLDNILTTVNSFKPNDDENRLANELLEYIKSNKSEASGIFSNVCHKLKNEELRSLYYLTVG